MTDNAENWPLYQGTKQLKAVPMSKIDYCHLRGWEVPSNEDPLEAGYVVEYQDNDSKPNVHGFKNYVSWTPARVFEAVYCPCGTHIERMMIELHELEEKIGKLDEFMRGLNSKFHELDDDTRALLARQAHAMHDYREALAERLALSLAKA
jgi:hypothetical protein